LRVRRRQALHRRSPHGAAHTARGDRHRDGRLRPAARRLPLPERSRMIRRALLLLATALLLAGCGGSSPKTLTVPPAKQYTGGNFRPWAGVGPGKPVKISFVIQQPNGEPLTDYKTGSGPHTGVHLIMVRRDLSTIIHTHPPIAADGTVSETVTFTEPG